MENLGSVGSIFLSKPISGILTEVAAIGDCTRRVGKLDLYIQLLESERNKVEAFKRELPYCMNMLEDAIETLKKEMEKSSEEMGRPEMENFIPMRDSAESDERRGWMSSVHLWSTPIQYEPDPEAGNHHPLLSLKSVKKDEGQESSGALKKSEEKRPRDAGGKSLSLSFAVADRQGKPLDLNSGSDSGLGLGSVKVRRQLSPQRKRRRCWSPELHRRFMEALQVLGGPQTATPKQIREQMQVEGLTNDEVKSHLQKYRLHIRKLPNRPLTGPIDYSWLASKMLRTAGGGVGGHDSASPPDHLHGGASVDSFDEDDDDSWKARLQRAMQ